jgi:hypothetical protein
MSNAPEFFTPPEIAARLRVKPERVVSWIRRGELTGVNLAERGSKRPRYRVSQIALDAFLAARQECPKQVAVTKPMRQSRQKPKDYIKFF